MTAKEFMKTYDYKSDFDVITGNYSDNSFTKETNISKSLSNKKIIKSRIYVHPITKKWTGYVDWKGQVFNYEEDSILLVKSVLEDMDFICKHLNKEE